jgi:predicted secreted protein
MPAPAGAVAPVDARDEFTLLAIITGSLSVLRHRCMTMDDDAKDEVFHLGTEAAADLALKLRARGAREIKLED